MDKYDNKELGYFVYFFSTDCNNWTYIHHSGLYYKNSLPDETVEYTYDEIGNNEDFCYDFYTHKGINIPFLKKKEEYKEYNMFSRSYIVKQGQSLYVKRTWNTVTRKYSFSELSRELKCDDFIEYLKDHGMYTCPINVIER